MNKPLTNAHRQVLRVLAVLVLGVSTVACGGGDDGDKVAADGDSSSSTTQAPGAGGGSATDGVDSADRTGVTAVLDSATDGGKVSSGSSGEGSTGGAAPATEKNVPDSTPGLPAAGEYRFHTTGTVKVGANPEQPVDMVTATTMTHLGNGKVRQRSEDQESVLEWKGAQVLLHTMDLTRPGFERHFEAKPPVQYAPTPLQVGQTWSWQLTATNIPTTIKQESRVDRLETVTVGGKSVNAIVVVTRLTISGDVNGTIDLTQWIDTATKLPARVHTKADIVTYTFKSDTTSDFTGFTAA